MPQKEIRKSLHPIVFRPVIPVNHTQFPDTCITRQIKGQQPLFPEEILGSTPGYDGNTVTAGHQILDGLRIIDSGGNVQLLFRDAPFLHEVIHAFSAAASLFPENEVLIVKVLDGDHFLFGKRMVFAADYCKA